MGWLFGFGENVDTLNKSVDRAYREVSTNIGQKQEKKLDKHNTLAQ